MSTEASKSYNQALPGKGGYSAVLVSLYDLHEGFHGQTVEGQDHQDATDSYF